MKHTRKWLLLQLLEQAGHHGVTTADLLNAGIGSRYGARILELREDGYTIRSKRERDGSYRYTLLDSPDVEHGAGTQSAPPKGDDEGSSASPVLSGRGIKQPSHAPTDASPALFELADESTGHWRKDAA